MDRMLPFSSASTPDPLTPVDDAILWYDVGHQDAIDFLAIEILEQQVDLLDRIGIDHVVGVGPHDPRLCCHLSRLIPSCTEVIDMRPVDLVRISLDIAAGIQADLLGLIWLPIAWSNHYVDFAGEWREVGEKPTNHAFRIACNYAEAEFILHLTIRRCQKSHPGNFQSGIDARTNTRENLMA